MKEALEIRNMKQADLVEKTGIGKSSISTYLTGSYEPKQRNIYKIAKALDVNEAWLMGNDVPMERGSYSDRLSTYHNELSNVAINNIDIGYEDIKLLKEFNKLNVKGRSEAINRVTELTYIPQYTEAQVIQFESKDDTKNKKYIPTEEDIRTLVARNGKPITREQAIDLISTLFSDDEDEE